MEKMLFCVNLSPSGNLSKESSCHSCKPRAENGFGEQGIRAQFLPLTFYERRNCHDIWKHLMWNSFSVSVGACTPLSPSDPGVISFPSHSPLCLSHTNTFPFFLLAVVTPSAAGAVFCSIHGSYGEGETRGWCTGTPRSPWQLASALQQVPVQGFLGQVWAHISLCHLHISRGEQQQAVPWACRQRGRGATSHQPHIHLHRT